MIEFHDLDTLIDEHEEYLPGADAIKQGFLCIAKEGDGTQFAYDVHTGKMYHIEIAYDAADATRDRSRQHSIIGHFSHMKRCREKVPGTLTLLNNDETCS